MVHVLIMNPAHRLGERGGTLTNTHTAAVLVCAAVQGYLAHKSERQIETEPTRERLFNVHTRSRIRPSRNHECRLRDTILFLNTTTAFLVESISRNCSSSTRRERARREGGNNLKGPQTFALKIAQAKGSIWP